MHIFTPLFLVTALVLSSGCSRGERVATNTVLANSNCKNITVPISQVTLAEVANFRGSELLEPTNTEPASEEVGSTPPMFIALYRGVQPTRGFELHLSDQALVTDDTQLTIPVYWTQPDPSKPHPLVDTHPCLVVSIPRRGWRTIEALDQHNQSLGVLTLPDATQEN